MSDEILDNYDEMEESILDLDTDDAVEPQAVEPGEYEVRITGFRKDTNGKIVRTSDKGNKFFIVVFDIPSEETSKSLSKIFSLPTDDMEPKRANAVKWELQCFKKAFGLQQIDFNNMVDRKGYALITKVGSEDSEYGIQNEIKKFIAGA